MDVQVIADPAGRLIWASDALPGATHDLTAARIHGIPAALAADGVKCWADKAYQGAGAAFRVPFRGKNLRAWRRRHNRDHSPVSAVSANVPWRSSSAGDSCGSSVAAPPESPRSSEPSSPSNSPADQDGRGSVTRCAYVDPHVYDDEINPGAAAWFKPSATHLLARVSGYLEILSAHGVECRALRSVDPARVIYEDDVQIVVVPHALDASDADESANTQT
ncbi:hypothetical protein J2S50_000027 [Streptomyces sp. DSM 40167]|nr:hypothetical protein [Streptomyces sp. DSM 40167]